MTDLHEFDDVVEALRSGLADVRYRGPAPVPPARRPATRTLAGALAVVIAAATLVVLGPWGRSPTAWANDPRPLTAEQRQRITHACATVGSDLDEAPSLPPTAVIDWRGSRVFAFFADDDRMLTCVLHEVRDDDFDEGPSTLLEFAPADLRDVDDDPRLSYAAAESAANGGPDHSLLIGQVAPQIARVTVEIPGRGIAEASVDGGWFSIWWPGPVEGTTLRAYDAQDRPIARAVLSLE